MLLAELGNWMEQ